MVTIIQCNADLLYQLVLKSLSLCIICRFKKMKMWHFTFAIDSSADKSGECTPFGTVRKIKLSLGRFYIYIVAIADWHIGHTHLLCNSKIKSMLLSCLYIFATSMEKVVLKCYTSTYICERLYADF